ncbi:uncharacterized protein LOC143852488 [Tasmannia lanceolata]|uniref:uncharacterized protein LOC143852488 n=1 Tax=Tasmannia lanceolata TaxID=3420 RepID=UPI0040637137
MEADLRENTAVGREESVLDESRLSDVRDRYCIPDQFVLWASIEGYRARNDSIDVCIYDEALQADFRFPINSFIAEVLRFYGLDPAQVAPNSWRTLEGPEEEGSRVDSPHYPGQGKDRAGRQGRQSFQDREKCRGDPSRSHRPSWRRKLGGQTGSSPSVRSRADNVFHPNWGVQKGDNSFSDNEVAHKIIVKSRLQSDRLRILHEPHETVETVSFGLLYQLGCYWSDMAEKCNNFSRTITKSNLQIEKLEKDMVSLGQTINDRDVEIERLNEKLKVQKDLTRKAISACDRQRETSQARQEAAMKTKEDELINFATDTYKEGFDECKAYVQEKYPDLDLNGSYHLLQSRISLRRRLTRMQFMRILEPVPFS